MIQTPQETESMAKKSQKTTPVRLSDEAIRWARIASGLTGESVAEYASRVVEERGREDSDRLWAELKKEKAPKSKGEPK